MKISALLHFYTAILLAVLATTASAATYLPETSPRTMRNSPLAPGEVAVVREARGTASIYVGGETGEVCRVAEPSTILGNRVEEIPADELAAIGDNVTFTNNAWYVFGEDATGTVSFVTRGGEDILSCVYEQYSSPGEFGMPTGSVTDEIAGSQLRIRIFVGNGTWACVSNVVCSRRAYGDEQTVNDLRRTEYLFEDDLGMWEFNGLRAWVSNLYNGNRGKDWSAYPAQKSVQLDGNPIFFSSRRRYSILQDESTNLVVNAGGRAAITVSFRGASGADGSFVITSYAMTNSTVYIGYTIDADNFDPANLGVQTATILNGVFYDMPVGSYTATASTVTIPNQTGPRRFYRLKYGNMTTDTLEVRLRGNVIVEDRLILKGLDGVYYNLSVSNGVITATAVE